MITTFGVPAAGFGRTGHAGTDSSSVLPITPGNGSPTGYCRYGASLIGAVYDRNIERIPGTVPTIPRVRWAYMTITEERLALFLDYENMAIGARENLDGFDHNVVIAGTIVTDTKKARPQLPLLPSVGSSSEFL